MKETEEGLNRRAFMKTSVTAAAVLAGGAMVDGVSAAETTEVSLKGGIPTRVLGRTKVRLPVLGHGGSAMVEPFRSTKGKFPENDFAKNVKMVRKGYDAGIRYFDTARNYRESEEIMGEALHDIRSDIYLATKLGIRAAADTRRSVETSLEKLKTDYLDAVQIHNPRDYRLCMEAHEELVKLRDEGIVRFFGITTHRHFENMYKVISHGGFDQILITMGYFPKGMVEIMSGESVQWRDMCVAKAAELDMGVVAMKVLGANIFSHKAKELYADYDEKKRHRLASAAIKWCLADERVHVLNIGMTLPEDIDADLKIIRADLTLTNEDRLLLAETSQRAFQTEHVKNMEIV